MIEFPSNNDISPPQPDGEKLYHPHTHAHTWTESRWNRTRKLGPKVNEQQTIIGCSAKIHLFHHPFVKIACTSRLLAGRTFSHLSFFYTSTHTHTHTHTALSSKTPSVPTLPVCFPSRQTCFKLSPKLLFQQPFPAQPQGAQRRLQGFRFSR